MQQTETKKIGKTKIERSLSWTLQKIKFKKIACQLN